LGNTSWNKSPCERNRWDPKLLGPHQRRYCKVRSHENWRAVVSLVFLAMNTWTMLFTIDQSGRQRVKPWWSNS
jgi:hypothetical protein